ncbi:phthiocerol/phenolphthiocerol synthesis polyketide synthase type I PpsB [Tsukamurella pulmonis]|uniref:SDR family NAD(P)-dependent oxidoreductase n=1 Tax=Tsukamurella pulmonis TaxID=47312 RepID=UPI001EDCC8B9|nr:type I polyketide synthase [Tsukamurella pulmonis]BDD84046.1 phthiocerol/phenolphthiocerol synthesis polyketide synthase type I PpsB [Tsukamurella pulmonis]
MTSPTTPDRRALITDALRRIDDLTDRLAIAEQGAREPVAVVGIGCRLPGGVDGPDSYWDLLERGGDGVVRVPEDRWDADALYSADHPVAGTICNRDGGFLTHWDPAQFDAEFFGISPREAAGMDPQHRLLLEVAWEALEHSGIVPGSLRGTRTGVYVGLTTADYAHTLSGELALDEIDPYIPFGSAHNFAAGRLSYFLGLNGPAVVLDTACSSSLSAMHLACQGLRRRESDAALVAGVNLVLSPENSIACSRWGMLAPDGHCKSFDAAADGYVRSEGCGVVVLKRLSDAVADGDRILALVRGTAVNQDGASSGQTVPNGPAQQALLRQALESSGLEPSDIDFVESHGTGTGLGDPIELDTLDRVFGERGDAAPLVVGAVKSNLGHLESAAGIAGVIKTVLALGRSRIPRNLHFESLTPHACAGAARFVFPTDTVDWPEREAPRRAGVSSFGVSGTNAHVVLEQVPAAEPAPVPAPPAEGAVHRLVLSGKSIERVRAAAANLADWLTGPGATVPLADVADEICHRRPRFPRIATVVADDHDGAVQGLRALAAGRPAPGTVAPQRGGRRDGIVFVFSGQGAQWAGMGRALLRTEPAFADAIRALEPDFRRIVGFSLEEALTTGEVTSGIDRIQPVLVGVQLALVELWRSRGVHPDAVIGHSMGEVAAAVTAGALSVADGLTVIATRSALMRRELAGRGAMAVLELDEAAAAEVVARHEGVCVAVVASPRQTVVAGDPERIDAVIAEVSARDLLARRVEVDVASHHATVDPILDELREALRPVAPTAPRIPFHSTVRAGDRAPRPDADYWAENLRRTVRFADAVAAAAAENGTFIEISPHPLLTGAIADGVDDAEHLVVGTLLRETPEPVVFEANLVAVRGPSYPEVAQAPQALRPPVAVPTTPWLRRRHWITPRAAAPGAAAPAADGGPNGWFLTLEHPAREASGAPDESSAWLVLADDGGEHLARALGAGSRGLPAAALRQDPDAVRAAFEGADRVLYAPAPAADGLDPAAARRVLGDLTALARLLAGHDGAPRLTVLTRNAEALAEGEAASGVHAALWGAGRTLALEHPEFWGGLVDVDAALPPALLAPILRAETGSRDGDDQVLHRAGVRRVPRLRRAHAPVARADVDHDRAQLVVGATGNIGGDVVRQLARMGAGTVVALSRRGGLPDGLAEEAAAHGTTLVPVAVDAADPQALAALFARFGADLPELGGIHVASLSGGAGQLSELTADEIDAMFRSKVDVLANLHALSLTVPVRDFVIFSSITGVIGSRWLGHYTAANAYADAVAAIRRHLGLPARVVDWGLFESWAQARPETASAGLTPMPNDAAVRCLPAVLGAEAPTRSIVVGADWPRLAENFRSRTAFRVVDDLLGAAGPTLAQLPTASPGTLTAPQDAAAIRVSAAERPHAVAHRVRGVEVVPVSVLAAGMLAARPEHVLRDLRFEYPIVLDQPRAVRVSTGPDSVTVSSSTDPQAPADRWIRHAEAGIGAAPDGAAPGLPDDASGGDLELPDYDAAGAADLARQWGVEGVPFHWEVLEHEAGPGALRARVRLPHEAAAAAAIDAAVHLARLTGRLDDGLLLPTAIGSLTQEHDLGPEVLIAVQRRADRGEGLLVDASVETPDGRQAIRLTGVRFASVDPIVVTAPEEAGPGPAVMAVPDLTTLAPAEVADTVARVLRDVLARELGTDPSDVDAEQPFPELGLDSMMAMAMLRDAKAALGVDLSATMLWDHPTVARLSAHIAATLVPAAAEDLPPEPATAAGADDVGGLLDELFESAESFDFAEGEIR